MAWKYTPRSWAPPTTGGRKGSNTSTQTSLAPTNFLKNQKAYDKLKRKGITARQQTLENFTQTDNTSYDQEFNNMMTNNMVEWAQQYSNIGEGMNNGTVDIATGTAAQRQLEQRVDDWQKFVGYSKLLIPRIENSLSKDKGTVGAMVLDSRINDIPAVKMLYDLWNNPKGMNMLTPEGTMTLQQIGEDGEVNTLNIEEFNSMMENGNDPLWTIEDPAEMLKKGFEGAKQSNPGWHHPEQKKVKNAQGQWELQTWDMYDGDVLRQGMVDQGSWDFIMNNTNSAPGNWEYILSHWDGDKTGWNPEWIGSGPNATDENGSYTKEAQEQRDQFARAFSDMAVRQNVPKDALIENKPFYSSAQQTSMYNANQRALAAALKNQGEEVSQEVLDGLSEAYAFAEQFKDKFKDGLDTEDQKAIVEFLNKNSPGNVAAYEIDEGNIVSIEDGVPLNPSSWKELLNRALNVNDLFTDLNATQRKKYINILNKQLKH